MIKRKLNILGCCVSRDSVDYDLNRQQFGSNEYEVLRYFMGISTYTMLDGNKLQVPIKLLMEHATNKQLFSQFRARCLMLDCCKGALNYLSEVKSDWLIIDLCNNRLPVVKWDDLGVLLTYSGGLSCCISIINTILNNHSYEIIQPWDLPTDIMQLRTITILNNIQNLYSAKQIILNEFYSVDSYICSNGKISKFSNEVIKTSSKWNELLSNHNNLAESTLKECHIIRFPENVIADSNHRWGLAPLHYHKLYYEYVKKAINIIVSEYDRSVEESLLELLRQVYSEKFATLHQKSNNITIQLDRDKWKTYSETIKSLIVRGLLDNCSEKLQNALFKNGFEHIAIYGDTEITKALIKALKRTSIVIDYLVENSSKPVSGIKTINRSDTEYPNCDVMLIADIYYYKDIKAKLEKMKVSFPFYNAAEFIKSLPVAGDA